MDTFIRVAEIWVPDADGQLLEWGGGLYGHAPDFGGVSRSMCFGRGEGLPGRVWEEGRPVLLHGLDGGYFQRSAAARAAGLTCAVAFPVYFGESLRGVIALFCGDVGTQFGAIEVWRNDPRVTSDLTLMDGVYGAGQAAFEAVSRQTYLPRGSGLPGLAWQRQASVFMDGLATTAKFLRAGEVAATELRRGLAFPCPVPANEHIVLALLSAPKVPIAARLESWVAADEGQGLSRAAGFVEPGAADAAVAIDPPPDAAILQAYASAVPAVSASASLIAWPVVVDGEVSEAMVLQL